MRDYRHEYCADVLQQTLRLQGLFVLPMALRSHQSSTLSTSFHTLKQMKSESTIFTSILNLKHLLPLHRRPVKVIKLCSAKSLHS
jgi:hypothetical protein